MYNFKKLQTMKRTNAKFQTLSKQELENIRGGGFLIAGSAWLVATGIKILGKNRETNASYNEFGRTSGGRYSSRR